MLYSPKFMRPSGRDRVPGVRFEKSFASSELETRQDITGITFVPGCGKDRTLYIGFEDGTPECAFMPLPFKYLQRNITMNGILEPCSIPMMESLSKACPLIDTIFEGTELIE